jgi:predicted NBD/HSP70 family sugar kinase
MSTLGPALVAIDLGASSYRIIHLQGSRLRAHAFPTRNAQSTLVEITRFLDDAGGHPMRVGLSRAFGADAHGVVSAWSNRPDWIGFPFVSRLRALASVVSVTDLDDGQSAALGEARLLGSPGPLATIMFGTGLATGVSRDGVPVATGEGNKVYAHTPLPRGTEVCPCGAVGCLQLYLTPPGDQSDPWRFGSALDCLVGRIAADHAVSEFVCAGGRLHRVRSMIETWGATRPAFRMHFSARPHLSALGGAILVAGAFTDRAVLSRTLEEVESLLAQPKAYGFSLAASHQPS